MEPIEKILTKLYGEHGEKSFRTGGLFSMWAGITERAGYWEVLFTSSADSHFGEGAISVGFNKKDGSQCGVYESIIRLWPVYEKEKAKRLYDWASGCLRKAAAPKSKYDIVRLWRFLFT